MSAGSYLQQIARRAVPHAPGVLMPRRLPRALPVTLPDELPPATVSGISVRGEMPDAPTTFGAEEVSVALPQPQRSTGPDGSSPDGPTAAAVVPTPAARASESPPVRPRVGLEMAARTLPVAPNPEAPPEATSTTRLTDARTGPPHEPPPVRQEPSPARRPMGRRANALPPEPLAIALASAVRWASSAPPAIARASQVSAPGATHERELPRAPTPRPTPIAVSDDTERDRLSREQPPRPRSPSVATTPAQVIAVAPPSRRRPPVPAKSVERFSGVHIGSVEVQLIPPSEPAPAVPRLAQASAATPMVPLARGLTSSIGLRQS